ENARRVRRGVGPWKLDRIADRQPAALVTRNRALDEEQTADRIGADHFEVLLGAVPRAHMASHLLVLEDAARILAIAGRAMRAVRDRNAVRRAETAEAPALHRAGKALALRHTNDVDHLPRNEMIGADVCAQIEQRI